MHRRLSALLLLAGSVLYAAEFQDGQAARAVIGQPAFSSREHGVVARALALSPSTLYVADSSGHVLTYDLSRLGATKTAGCPVCLVTPQAANPQNVFEGIAASAVNGTTIVVADAKSHRVMLWYGNSPMQKPDVVLGGFSSPLSVALDNQRLFVGDAVSHHVYVWNGLPKVDNQLPDVTLGVAEGVEGPGANTIQTPAALASDGANLYVADSFAHRVLVFSPADTPVPQVLNAATLAAGPVAPGTLVSLDHAAATSSVFLNGMPVRVTESNGEQLQVQIPYDLGTVTASSLWTQTRLEDGSFITSRPVALRLTAASPGIFAFGLREPRTGLLLHAPAGVPLSPEDPAKPDEVLSVWATGLGAVSSEPDADGAFDTLIPVRATINGNSVDVLSAQLSADSTGVYEIRFRLPSVLLPRASLVLFQNDSKSNAVMFPVRR